ncbi:MAG: deoxyribodipyrimidine photolyase, partial [Haloquadratum sp. J07HQX50]
MRVFWHREDLRATDNRGLMQAAQDAAEADEHLLPVFIFDSLTTDHDGNPRMQYLLDSLAELQQWYRNHGGDIYVTVGNAVDTFEQLLATYDINGVYWNRLYNKEARARDEQVKETIKAAQVDVETVRDELFFEPGDITTNKGEPYSVYTYFWKKWRDRPKETRVAHPPAPVLAKEEGETIPSMEDIDFSPPQADIQPAGMNAAAERLETFCDDGIFRYESDRDYPTREGVSRLSADLSAGTIGVRTVHDATVEAKERASEEETDSVEEYQSQLAWREFYTHVLYFNPDVETENYKS